MREEVGRSIGLSARKVQVSILSRLILQAHLTDVTESDLVPGAPNEQVPPFIKELPFSFF